MSKIYEALLRAEQERTASTGRPAAPAPQPPAPEPQPERPAPAAVAAVATAEPVAEVSASAPAVEPVYVAPPAVRVTPAVAPAPSPVVVPAPYVAEVPPAFPPEPAPTFQADTAALLPGEFSASSVPPLDLAGIRVLEWKPLMEKLPALQERGSAVEQFRSLRTRLFGFRDLNRLKSVMVSSGLPREGKSFVAANLAVSLARHKASRVLLIDGDMRRSSQHVVFGTEQSPGLTTYLSGQASIVEVMQRARLNADGTPLFTGLGSLTFIAGGLEGDKAADLAGSARFKQLIDAASPYFDWIIVDSSPVNLVTDGVNLANACDGVLMVARGGVTKFESAQRAIAELKSSKILGVVLNAVEASPATEGYYGYSSYDSAGPTSSSPNP